MVERQLGKLRSGVGRLIDSYTEGLISKPEFEPRIAGLRRRVAKLEGEAMALQNAAEQTRSLHLVIGKLETFAATVQDRLGEAEWDMKRDLVCALVRRIEIDDQHVRVVFRVEPAPSDGAPSRRLMQHCPGRHPVLASADEGCRLPLGAAGPGREQGPQHGTAGGATPEEGQPSRTGICL